MQGPTKEQREQDARAADILAESAETQDEREHWQREAARLWDLVPSIYEEV